MVRAFGSDMSSLRESLQSLAAGFAIDLVRAIQGASLAELHSEVAGVVKRERSAQETSLKAVMRSNGGRLPRRSTDDIAGALNRVVDVLRGHDGGLRAERIREMLCMQSKELPRVLSEGLGRGKLRKEGQKRATTYFAI
jgi:hypothetical protein